MSKSVQTLANARKGSDIKKAGFKSGVHARPEFKAWFDVQMEGGANVAAIHREACNKWGTKNVPSVSALKNYVKRYWIPEHSVQIHPDTMANQSAIIESKAKLATSASEYDAFDKLLKLAEAQWNRYESFRTKEEQMNVPIAGIEKALENYQKTLAEIVTFEIKLGIRVGDLGQAPVYNDNRTLNNIATTAENINLHMPDATNGQENSDLHKDGVVDVDPIAVDPASLADLNKLIEFREGAKAHAISHGIDPDDPLGNAQDSEPKFSVFQSSPVGF